MPSPYRNWWRPACFGIAVALTITGWLITVMGLFSQADVPFRDPLSGSVWLCFAAAALLLLLTQLGQTSREIYLHMVIAVGVNVLVSEACSLLRLPFYFDSLGTIFIAIVGGPIAGMVTALSGALISGLVHPSGMAYAPVAALLSVLVASIARCRLLDRVGRVLVVGTGLGFLVATLAVYATELSLSGDGNSGTSALAEFFQLLTHNERLGLIIQAYLSDPLDKIFSMLLVCMYIRFAPAAVRQTFTTPTKAELINSILRRQV